VRAAESSSLAAACDAAARELRTCVASGLLPAAVIEVGTHAGVVSRAHCGNGIDDNAIFDLASLTKVLGTGLVAMSLLGRRSLDLDARVRDSIPAWAGDDRTDVRLRDLLAHASGLPGHLPLHDHHPDAATLVSAAARAPLARAPRTAAIYSDLGFIVLGRALEAIGNAPLDQQVHALLTRVTSAPLMYGPVEPSANVQPTGVSAWRGRVLRGEVHDDNAAAMGGVAGHAGLFGTAGAIGDVARTLLGGLRGEDTALAPAWAVRAFARQSPVSGSSRALAWDTALPTSSSGRYLTRRAIGHTGFTGTSLWIDPVLDLYVVLLTNRVAGRASADDIATIRRSAHDTIGKAALTSRHA